MGADVDEIATFWRNGHVVIEVTVRARASEIAALSPEQAEAFMAGLARCLSARTPDKRIDVQR